MINWKLRFRNRATLVALVGLIVAFIYQFLGLIRIVPAVSENEVMNLCLLLIDILVCVGIVVDPTTAGLKDSAQALEYEEPRMDGGVDEVGAEDPEDDEILPE